MIKLKRRHKNLKQRRKCRGSSKTTSEESVLTLLQKNWLVAYLEKKKLCIAVFFKTLHDNDI